MQPKSLFAFALMLAAAPAAFACTVTVNEGNDDEGDAAVNDSDDTTDESDDPTTDPTSDTDEPTPPGEDSGTVDSETQPGSDSGAAPDGADGGPADSGTDPSSPEAQDASADETSSEADGGDAETDPTEEGDAAAPSGGTVKTGSVTLTQSSLTVLEQEIVTSTAGAGFSIVTQGGPPPEAGALPCESETVGSCTLQVCDLTDSENNPEPAPSTVVRVSAGDVGIAGLSEEITLSSSADGTYTPVTGMAKLWEGGEAVTASAPGSDDVPEFSIDLVAPSAVSWSSPELSLVAATPISRASALEATWTEGAEGTLTLMLAEAASDEVSRSVLCTVAVSEGSVTVDPSLLTGFGDEGFMSASVSATATETVEDWSITVSASASLVSGQVTFTD